MDPRITGWMSELHYTLITRNIWWR